MAVAQIRPDWTVGTITLTSGSVDFTTTGSALETAAIQAGDTIMVNGLVLVIATITGQNAGTLMEPCPDGAAVVDYPIRIRFQPVGSRYNGATADMIQLLGSGNVYAFSELEGYAGGVPVFTGPGSLEVADKSTFVDGVKFDAQVNTLPDRAVYDGEAKGFVVLVSDVGDGRSAVYSKLSNASGDWSEPAYVTGPKGDVADITVGSTTTLAPGSSATVTNSGTPQEPVLNFGIPAGDGFLSRGDYSPATAYVKGDVVQYNGSSWIAKQSTTGNAPPAHPATNDANWQLLAKMGDGGDMFQAMYDPTGQQRDIFAAINDKTSMYDSVAAAQAATIPANIQAVMLSGYYNAGDGGIALYRRVSVEPAHIGKFQSADGTWWEIVGDVLSVKAFGAKVDEITNDSASIQGAIAKAYISEVPVGVSMIDATVVVDNTATGEIYNAGGYRSKTVKGLGAKRTALRSIAGGVGPLIKFDHNKDTSSRHTMLNVDGFSCDGAGVSGRDGIEVNNAAYFHLADYGGHRCDKGISFKSVLSSSIRDTRASGNKIGLNAVIGTGFSHPNAIEISSTVFGDNSDKGVFIDGAHNVTMYSGSIENNGTQGVQTAGGAHVKFIGGGEGDVGVNFVGVYFEGNAGGFDIHLENTMAGRVTCTFIGCNFTRLSNSKFVTNCIKTTGEIDLVLIGCTFSRKASYVASSSRNYINASAETKVRILSCKFQDPIEAGGFYESMTRGETFVGSVTSSGQINGPIGWTCAKLSTGIYKVTTNYGLLPSDFTIQATSTSDAGGYVERIVKEAGAFTVVLIDKASGSFTDQPFDFSFYWKNPRAF